MYRLNTTFVIILRINNRDIMQENKIKGVNNHG